MPSAPDKLNAAQIPHGLCVGKIDGTPAIADVRREVLLQPFCLMLILDGSLPHLLTAVLCT